MKKFQLRRGRSSPERQNPPLLALLEPVAIGQSPPMPVAPGIGPSCLGPPATVPSSLAGVQGAPQRPGISKPSWIVRTESNVRRERPKRPDPPCNVCKGTGTIGCRNCFGRGRTNHADRVMLPKGEWPLWCRICGGSGLDCCLRCHGTGEYREPMGFHFTAGRK